MSGAFLPDQPTLPSSTLSRMTSRWSPGLGKQSPGDWEFPGEFLLERLKLAFIDEGIVRGYIPHP